MVFKVGDEYYVSAEAIKYSGATLKPGVYKIHSIDHNNWCKMTKNEFTWIESKYLIDVQLYNSPLFQLMQEE